VPIDPNVMAEKEQKRKLAMQHQEALKKQVDILQFFICKIKFGPSRLTHITVKL